jgi:hypothetical protein
MKTRKEKEEEIRQKSCLSKAKLTERAAQREARFLSGRLRESVQAYKCDYCGHWHVGHRVPRRNR